MIAAIVSYAINLMIILIFVRVIVSWIPDLAHKYRDVVRIIYKVTDPVLRPLQSLVPPRKLGGVDISPVLAILALQLLSNIILSLLASMGR